MKYLMLVLMMFSVSAMADVNLDGQWKVIDRRCSNGSEAQDRFVLGRDTMEVNINGQALKLSAVIEKDSFAMYGTIFPSQHKIRVHINPGFETDYFWVDSNGHLKIFESNFGPGGSCPVGDYAVAEFVRE